MLIASQTTPLDDHDNHCLDAMVEYGEVDAGTYMAMMLFADRKDISDILYGDSDGGWRYRVSEKLMRLADNIITNQSKEVQGCLVFLAIQQALRTMRTHATILADWAVSDMCEGGSLQPFKKTWKPYFDYRIPNKTRRKLYSRKWIKRYIRNNKETRNILRVFQTISKRLLEVPVDFIKSDSSIADSIDADLKTIFRRSMKNAGLSNEIIREQRKVLKRSMRAAEAFVPKETVHAFIRNEEITVTGNNLILKATKTANLFSKGHGAFSVSVHTKEDVFLARLCVYFENTPVLDQLIGMVLFVFSGCEEEFVRSGNVINLSEAGRKHPLFERDANMIKELQQRLNSARSHMPYELVRNRGEKYWNDTGDVWLTELSAYLLGSRCSLDIDALKTLEGAL